MPKVIIWRDGAIESEFDPGHRDWRIGRSESNDITLLDPRKSVSRFHAELREEGGRWIFIDLNSQNGSWKDGQRVNRLELEHGHEVLFGDYKLSFEDVQVAPPPPPVPEAGLETAAVRATEDVPIRPDETLLMPGSKSGRTPATPAGPPPPVVRPAAKPPAPRKGVNPVILVLFLVTMLGAVAVVAWRLLTDSGPAEQPVAEDTVDPGSASSPEQPETANPTPASAGAGTTEPASTENGVASAGVAGGTPNTPARTEAAPAASPGPASPVPGTPAAAAAGPSAPPVAAGARPPAPRPKRAPAAPAESPVLVARYEDGRRALAAARYPEAQRAFEAVLAQQPTFRDAAARLEEARQGQAAMRQKALDEAQSLEASGDWARAVTAYERAGASAQASAAREKMAAAGDDAYRKARQFDARNRPTDAIGWYQRAVEWLPDSDARKATAQERLAALKGGR